MTQAVPYDDASWRPVPDNIPGERLRDALRSCLDNEAWIGWYAAPSAINGLFSWAAFDSAWCIQAFMLNYGLHHIDAAPYRTPSIARLLDISIGSAGTGVQQARRALSKGHRLLADAPLELRLRNPYREIGIPYRAWHRLAEHRLFTLADLCRLTPAQVENFRGVDKTGLAVIQQQLHTVGLALSRG